MFIEGVVPGERVAVELYEERKRFAKGSVAAVLEASPTRSSPACVEVARGCGGCGWAHIHHSEQLALKASMVEQALGRIGKIAAPEIAHAEPLARTGFRTTLRAAVVDGQAALRQARSQTPVMIDGCLVAHPLIEALLTEGRFGDATEVTLRVGARTGDQMVITNGDPQTCDLPDGVLVVSARPVGRAGITEERAGITEGRAGITERVLGSLFEISPGSFFQTRADGADQLVELVSDGLRQAYGQVPARLVDLCAGVGLFGALIEATEVVAVESNRSAVQDAMSNLQRLRPPGTSKVVKSTVERWRPESAQVVVADPSRVGLKASGVAAVVATGCEVVALVSCDAGSLGRDAGLLVEAGYSLDRLTLVDLFPDTPRIEAVSILSRR